MSDVGRPLFDGKDEDIVIQKLESAFSLDCTVDEACFYADISRSAFYVYRENHPEFQDRVERLRKRPVLIARKTVVDNLEKDPDLSMKYLERKVKDEFSTRTETTGKDGMPLNAEINKLADTIEKVILNEAADDQSNPAIS
jgi:hypothetical protein